MGAITPARQESLLVVVVPLLREMPSSALVVLVVLAATLGLGIGALFFQSLLV